MKWLEIAGDGGDGLKYLEIAGELSSNSSHCFRKFQNSPIFIFYMLTTYFPTFFLSPASFAPNGALRVQRFRYYDVFLQIEKTLKTSDM